MSSNTTRVSLYKPAGGEDINVTTDLNNNLDKIDTNLNFRVVASASARNAITPFWAGLNVRETDTGNAYVSNGSAPISASWDQIATANTYNSALNISTSATGNTPFNLRVGADANNRYHIKGDGANWWGAGGATAVDTNLYRSAANTLKTDDSLIVLGTLNVTGTSTFGGDQTVTGNQTISGDLAVAGIGQNQYVDKPALQALTVSNTTGQNVTNMVLPVASNGVYTFRMLIWVTSAANAAGDVKFNFTLPTGAVMDWMGNGPDVGLTAAAVQAGNWQGVTNSNGGTALSFGASTTSLGIELYGRVVMSSTAGNMQLQASQATSSVSATTIGARSWFVLTRVA